MNKHSGKIAAAYVAYVAAMTGIRYGCEDEKDKWWYEYIAVPSTALALLLEYQCFFIRKYFTQDLVDWYEDPMFYAHTAVKFMRFGSLMLSSKYANKIVKYSTGNELTDDTYFNDFFYNNAARMVLAIAPLIVYESTGDVKILSIATAVDVLTTVRSDMKCGDAISMANDFNTKKTTSEKLRLQSSELQEVVVGNHNPPQRSQ